ncbi:TPA: hypothetical protein KEW43_000731 [Proteus mirabilis]|nr:hypothetical protein [Proteus mirabilis]
MKYIITCPVCKVKFDVRIPLTHINQYHTKSTDSELMKIRDARREALKTKQPSSEFGVTAR